MTELDNQTTINIQEKANLIWAIADKLVGTYKPHEYGNVILPMCVIKGNPNTQIYTSPKYPGRCPGLGNVAPLGRQR